MSQRTQICEVLRDVLEVARAQRVEHGARLALAPELCRERHEPGAEERSESRAQREQRAQVPVARLLDPALEARDRVALRRGEQRLVAEPHALRADRELLAARLRGCELAVEDAPLVAD